MDDKKITGVLSNYRSLLKKIEVHIQHMEKTYAGLMACKKGCDTCCKFLSLFPVEALALANGFNQLSPEKKEAVIRKIKREDQAECPLLINSECVLYSERPVICRTHGYPIYMEKEGEAQIDFCPKNFKGIISFSNDALLNIDQLNMLLTAVNRLFLETMDTPSPLPDRIPVSDALFLMADKKDESGK